MVAAPEVAHMVSNTVAVPLVASVPRATDLLASAPVDPKWILLQ